MSYNGVSGLSDLRIFGSEAQGLGNLNCAQVARCPIRTKVLMGHPQFLCQSELFSSIYRVSNLVALILGSAAGRVSVRAGVTSSSEPYASTTVSLLHRMLPSWLASLVSTT